MKNIKLLLGSVATLALTTAAANAAFDSESAIVEVDAEIIHARELSATPLSFGRIVIPDDQEGLIVNILPSGETSLAHGIAGYILAPGTKGIVTGANCSQLSYPSSTPISLTPPTGTSVHDAEVDGLTCTDNSDGNATFSGRLTINNEETEMGAGDGAPIPAGKYTGQFTVTAIYPVETPSSGD